MMDKKYTDSLAGAVKMLRECSTLKLNPTPAGRPDPHVDGVWMVYIDPKTNDGQDSAIAYLAGYCDAWGRLREMNDFETGVRCS